VFSTGADAAAATKNWASDTRVLAFNEDAKTGAGGSGGKPAKAKKLVRWLRYTFPLYCKHTVHMYTIRLSTI